MHQYQLSVLFLFISLQIGKESSGSTYCGEELHAFKHRIFSNSKTMLVSFRSNQNFSDVGFKCGYELILYAS